MKVISNTSSGLKWNIFPWHTMSTNFSHFFTSQKILRLKCISALNTQIPISMKWIHIQYLACVRVCLHVSLGVLFPANDVSRFFPRFFFLQDIFSWSNSDKLVLNWLQKRGRRRGIFNILRCTCMDLKCIEIGRHVKCVHCKIDRWMKRIFIGL